jgi:hypothetical protein
MIIMVMSRMMMRMRTRKNAECGLVASHLQCRRDEDRDDKVGEWQAVMMRRKEAGDRAIRRRFSETDCVRALRMGQEKGGCPGGERFGRLEKTARSMGEGTVISGSGQMLTWSSSQTAWDHHGTAPDTRALTRTPNEPWKHTGP